jgi:hypothetical protein
VFAQHKIARLLQVFVSPPAVRSQQQFDPKQSGCYIFSSLFFFGWMDGWMDGEIRRHVFYLLCHTHKLMYRNDMTRARILQQDWPVAEQKWPEEAASCFIRSVESAAPTIAKLVIIRVAANNKRKKIRLVVVSLVGPASVRAMIYFFIRPAI